MKSFSGMIASIIPPALLIAAARRFLKLAGVGQGGIVAKSGELDAMATALARSGNSGGTAVFFDVGANIGEWSLAVVERWPDAELHLFEPSVDHMSKLAAAMKGHAHTVLNDCALGTESGTATLYKDASITGLASMTRRDLGHLGIAMEITETIRVDTIDAYCKARQIKHIDYLKIDVEGHELDVLNGAKSMLGNQAIRAIQFEFGGCNIDTRTYFRDFYGLLTGHGFELFVIAPGGRLNPVGPYREFLEQFSTTNYVAIRPKI